jgi:hypothetical protein
VYDPARGEPLTESYPDERRKKRDDEEQPDVGVAPPVNLVREERDKSQADASQRSRDDERTPIADQKSDDQADDWQKIHCAERTTK